MIRAASIAGWLGLQVLVPFFPAGFGNHLFAGEIADEIDRELGRFVNEFCISCHDSSTTTRLDFTKTSRDFSDQRLFQRWVRVFDRLEKGEMPPAGESQPDPAVRKKFLAGLEKRLYQANRKRQQSRGRVPSRRLSRLQYEHTLQDLLDIGGKLARFLPPENESGSFDVIAAQQEMSPVHVRGFLKAAETALDEAVQLGRQPYRGKRSLNYFQSPYIQMWVDRPTRMGGGTIFKTGTDVVMFRGENHVFRSDHNGYRPPVAGRYRITVRAAAYQPRSSITLSLKRQNDVQGDSELFAAWDLSGKNYREVSTTHYLRPDDFFYVSADELEPAPDGKVIYNSQPASEFRGEGVSIRSVVIEGPLEGSWPPDRTQALFPATRWKHAPQGNRNTRQYQPLFESSAADSIRKAISRLAWMAFQRELSPEEIDRFLGLAQPDVANGVEFVEAAKRSLKAILVSPELIFLAGDPGALKDGELARRLSFFLWRSLPDSELVEIANEKKLVENGTLLAQVDRMIGSPRFDRFVNEFLDQWLDLDQIDATTPDYFLYPEYDDVLRRAMLAETREFFKHLVRDNLSVSNLVDSEFTFLNRRLAEHYGVEGVVGEQVRRVNLGPNHVRGGILGQASIAKVTANGTVTTPVRRGHFILSNLLGLPPDPPPPGVGSVEPDTRGATTIREVLGRHQSEESCAVCHRKIDPPGFAMEVFDPVGNYRTRYRSSRGNDRAINVGLRLLHKEYILGKKVDSAGTTPQGDDFRNIQEYKNLLLKSSDQVARNVVSRLIEFSTGGEIEFADREVVESILDATRGEGFPLRSLIHQVVSSRLFRNR
ncbi:MAG: DUF1592 domain-containing protein [Planctomycetota bacterium]|nr:DUF1592 domain-containing protein [Planctomycetota bacterium]